MSYHIILFEGGCPLKRLKNILLSLQQNEITYKKLYDGKIHMLAAPESNDPPINLSEPIFWQNEIFYKIERTNRLELSKPTITIGIPIKKLKIMEGLINGMTRVSQKGIPAADYCLRSFLPYIHEMNETITNQKRTDQENGRYYLYEPNGKVLKRNSAFFQQLTSKYYESISNQVARLLRNPKQEWYLNLMIMVQLPDKKIKQTFGMLTRELPHAVESYIQNFDQNAMKKAISLYNKQEEIRQWLKESDYCTFIAEGSILPREKDTDQAMKKAKPFVSNSAMRIRIGDLYGMGIKKGVTVITGGGYSGKSTLLDAISNGVYNHIANDGREYVITDSSAMKISAEDGRSVTDLNISAFIRWIPGASTNHFSTSHASGSTSQAANIIEAVNDGSKLLLIDEDKSATNFMIRDEIMQRLVEHDPIIPFTDRVQELSEMKQVSTILVIGGSSEYLRVCDHVILMNHFQPEDITLEAKKLVTARANYSTSGLEAAQWELAPMTKIHQFSPYVNRNGYSEHLEVSEKGFLEIGEECIDVRMVHNLASVSQLTTIGFLIRKLQLANKEPYLNKMEVVESYLNHIDQNNLDEVYSTYFTNCMRWLELPRKYEVLAVLHRMRHL